MNKDTTYNGWTNYETWRVKTDEGIGRDYAMAFLQNVDWQEIAEHYEQDEEVA